MITVAISYSRAKAINAVPKTFRYWTANAYVRGVSASAVGHVEDQWREGHVKLILPLDEWSEIQMKRG